MTTNEARHARAVETAKELLGEWKVAPGWWAHLRTVFVMAFRPAKFYRDFQAYIVQRMATLIALKSAAAEMKLKAAGFEIVDCQCAECQAKRAGDDLAAKLKAKAPLN